MNKYIKVTQNACIFMVNDTADVDNWKGKTIQLYVWEVPEQLLNKLKSKWLVEMAAKIYPRYFKCSTKRFSFSTKLNFSHVILLSLSCEISPDFTQLDRGPPGLSTNQSFATTLEENFTKWHLFCFPNLWILKLR